jgi:hypothetical protein
MATFLEKRITSILVLVLVLMTAAVGQGMIALRLSKPSVSCSGICNIQKGPQCPEPGCICRLVEGSSGVCEVVP